MSRHLRTAAVNSVEIKSRGNLKDGVQAFKNCFQSASHCFATACEITRSDITQEHPRRKNTVLHSCQVFVWKKYLVFKV